MEIRLLQRTKFFVNDTKSNRRFVMDYIGKWVFHSIGMQDDEKGMIYLNGDEYLASPMPYIDETDEEAVADTTL